MSIALRKGARVDRGALVEVGPGLDIGQTADGLPRLEAYRRGGFLYVPTTDGPPTAAPEAEPGTAALAYDATNRRLYVHADGAWASVQLA